MRSLLQHLSWVADRALSVVIWLHGSVMLFICLFWLLPLIVLVVISAFIYDLRPIPRDRMQEVSLYGLLVLPLWIGVCLYAQFAATSASHRIRHGGRAHARLRWLCPSRRWRPTLAARYHMKSAGLRVLLVDEQSGFYRTG